MGPAPARKGAASERRGALAGRLSLDDGAGYLFRVAGARATAAYERLTGQTAVTPQQFGLLLTLHQRGALTLTALAEAVRLDRSTLGEMARRMAARGLLRRAGNDADGRSVKVSLAPAGEAALLQLVEGAAALQDALLAPLPPGERRRFLRQLKRVALAEHADP